MKKNWLVVSKMTWGTWKIFTRALESLESGTLMGSFYPKSKIYEPKSYRGVMCHDNEEWCKIWKGIDFSRKKPTWRLWQILTWALKSSKLSALMGFFCKKYIFNVNRTEALCVMTLKSDGKFEEKLTCVWKMTLGIWQMFARELEYLKIGTLMGSFHPK